MAHPYVKQVREIVEQFQDGAIMHHEMVNKIILISHEETESLDYLQAKIDDLKMRLDIDKANDNLDIPCGCRECLKEGRFYHPEK